MPQKEIEELKSMFTDGSGFGDPDARRNAELRLQTLLVERQDRMAAQLNLLTLLLVVAAFFNALLLAIQVFTK
jgi:hypothetical protein